MKMRILLLAILGITCQATYSQEKLAVGSDFPVLTGAYFGQKAPGNVPEIFAPGIISTESGWEAAITFSPDGKEFFYTRRPSIQGSQNRIMHSELKDGKWTLPKLAPFARDIVEYESFISPDGQRIYYNSERHKPDLDGSVGEIWFSEKTSAGWGDSKYLSATINKGWVMFVTASENNTLYFTGGYERIFGVYKSEFINGVFQEPEYLPEEINYIRGAHPYIAPDESYLIFDAQPDGMGKSQLFISFKDENGNWTRAKKFDKTINASYTENIPNVSPDGKYFFFHRNNDIYWVDSKIIEELRPAL
jgi:hypothetical protein